jgi:two-component system chemotaxis response regulator CheY
MQTLEIADLSILVIEPSSTQLKVIVQHLQNEGISHIEGVSTAEQAQVSLQTFQPDLIVSAMYLPDQMATELIKELKHDEAYKDIPFMLISSENSPKILDIVRQSGVVAILPKPFNHEDLKRALKTTIEYIDPEELELEYYDIEKLRVLVVDDSNLARKHITRVLNNMGINNIITANDGTEAVELFQAEAEAFDLIVTDYNMPEMDGQQLTQYIREELNNPFIPILMVTSEHDEARLSNIQKAGVSAIFDKPFEPQTVKEMLYRILEE